MKYLYLRRFLRSLIGVQANTVAEAKANVAGPNQNRAISEQGFYNWKTERRVLAAFRRIVPRVKLPLRDLSSDEVVTGLEQRDVGTRGNSQADGRAHQCVHRLRAVSRCQCRLSHGLHPVLPRTARSERSQVGFYVGFRI
jgi:hypothetical protein